MVVCGLTKQLVCLDCSHSIVCRVDDVCWWRRWAEPLQQDESEEAKDRPVTTELSQYLPSLLPYFNILTTLSFSKPRTLTSKRFTQELLQSKLLEFITTARLPFRIVEHTQFKELVEAIQLAQSKIYLPSARTLRRYLDTTVQDQQKGVLSKLPEGSRLSIALDCWTSPFQQAFMATTGYFLDHDWNYCEVLLGFEHLHGSHKGQNLSKTVIQILQNHGIANRVLSITTDNATSNDTLMRSIQEVIQLQSLTDISIFRIPCISHVIQLSLNNILGNLKATPVNKEAESEWSNERTQSLLSKRPTRQIVDTLKKVCYSLDTWKLILILGLQDSRACCLY